MTNVVFWTKNKAVVGVYTYIHIYIYKSSYNCFTQLGNHICDIVHNVILYYDHFIHKLYICNSTSVTKGMNSSGEKTNLISPGPLRWCQSFPWERLETNLIIGSYSILTAGFINMNRSCCVSRMLPIHQLRCLLSLFTQNKQLLK